jgi:hypothetical protein
VVKAAHRLFEGCLQPLWLQLLPGEPPKSGVIGYSRQLESRAQTLGKLQHFLNGVIVQTKILFEQ